MKKRKNLLILLTSMSFLLIFALTALSQQKPVAGQATQKTTQLQPVTKAPSIDPNTLLRLQGIVTRSTMVNTLMGNQTTKVILENLAKNAKINVNELSIKTFAGNPVSQTTQGQQIDQLNWNAGIKFSFIKNRPTFYLANSLVSLGTIKSEAVIFISTDTPWNISNDLFYIKSTDPLWLNLYLPLGTATYMIAVQVVSTTAPEITLYYPNSSNKLQNIIPLTSRDGWVGLTQISPYPFQNVGRCAFSVNFNQAENPTIIFGGFTITRL